MSAVAAIRPPDKPLKRFVPYSFLLHCALAAACVIGAWTSHSGENWGSAGGSMTVGMVGSVPAIPLPHPEVESPSRVVDNTNGLFKSEPMPLPKPDLEAVPIPKFEKEKKKPPPKITSRPSKLLENPTPPPENAVPYGNGGRPTVPVSASTFTMGNTGATSAGLIAGGAGQGDFGSRFSWYVEAVQRRVSSNWIQSAIDPGVGYAPRVMVTFTILRNGTVTNVQITQSSNVPSVDTSAVRAVEASSPLQPLPPAYSGSNVNVEFYFDYHR